MIIYLFIFVCFVSGKWITPVWGGGERVCNQICTKPYKKIDDAE